jgi:hypothetical protein
MHTELNTTYTILQLYFLQGPTFPWCIIGLSTSYFTSTLSNKLFPYTGLFTHKNARIGVPSGYMVNKDFRYCQHIYNEHRNHVY